MADESDIHLLDTMEKADESDIHLLDTMEKVSSYPRNLVVTVVCYISAVNPQTCLAAS